jgi:hypothetical protein
LETTIPYGVTMGFIKYPSGELEDLFDPIVVPKNIKEDVIKYDRYLKKLFIVNFPKE